MPGKVGISDLSVSRAAAAGWGTATSGQVYTVTTGTAADFNVTAGVGNMIHNALNTRHQVQLPWGTYDWDDTITVTSPVVTTGGGSIEARLVGRQIDASNYYYGAVLFGLTGALSVTVGQRLAGTVTALGTFNTNLVYAASTAVRIRSAGVTVAGVGVRLFVKIWLPATQLEPVAWSGTFLQSFATINSGGILGGGLVGVESIVNTGVTNTLPITVAFTNYQSNSVGLPYPLSTEGVCADPTSTTFPKAVELAATALALDAYATNTIDPLASALVTRPYCIISSNNQTMDLTNIRSVPFDTVDINVGTLTNLATANGVTLGVGTWLVEAEELLVSGSTVVEAQFVWATGGGYRSPNGASQVSMAQRTTTTIGSAMQLSGLIFVTSGTALVGVTIQRTDASGPFTWSRISLMAYKVA